MQPGQTEESTFAIVRERGADRLDSVRRLRAVAREVGQAAPEFLSPPVPLREDPAASGLWPPFPNPTDGPTTLRYDLADAADARLALHDVRGRLVMVLMPGVDRPACTSSPSMPAGTRPAFASCG